MAYSTAVRAVHAALRQNRIGLAARLAHHLARKAPTERQRFGAQELAYELSTL